MAEALPSAVTHRPALVVRGGLAVPGVRAIARETPVAIVVNGGGHAVMMATPADLEDFAIGFALTQGLVEHPGEIEGLEVVAAGQGVECRLWIPADRAARLGERRRAMAGPTGCGVCGVESIAEALPEPRRASAPHVRFSLADVMAARAALDRALPIGEATRASHAAGLYRREDGLVMAREDVGRHNALDKLAGAIARAGQQDVGEALVVLTSRISVEMVQKAAAIGAGALVAISAPTSLAIETAERAGLLLVGVARADGCEIFANAHRIEGTAASAA